MSYRGHDHFWERALSRRTLMAGTAGAVGVLAGSSLWGLEPALAAGSDPRPIPHGFLPNTPAGTSVHIESPDGANDQSAIFDFDGVVAVAHHQGSGTAILNGVPVPNATFDTDMRFMDGFYIGMDGKTYRGSLGFV